MLESAEIGHAISKAAYAREEPRLREALLNAQYDLSQSQRGPVLLILLRRRGRRPQRNGEQAHRMDGPAPHPRLALSVRAARRKLRARRRGATGARCRARGRHRHLPQRVVHGARARRALAGELDEATSSSTCRRRARSRADAGRRRLRAAQVLDPSVEGRADASASTDLGSATPRTQGELTRDDRERSRTTSKLRPLWEEMLREIVDRRGAVDVVEGADERYRELTVGKILLDAMQRRDATRTRTPTRATRRRSRAAGGRQRRADPQPRPLAEARRAGLRDASSTSGRRGSPR